MPWEYDEPWDRYYVTDLNYEAVFQMRQPWHNPFQPVHPLALDPFEAIEKLHEAFNNSPLLYSALMNCRPLHDRLCPNWEFFGPELERAVGAEEVAFFWIGPEMYGWLPPLPGEEEPRPGTTTPRPTGVHDLYVHVYDTQGNPIERAAVKVTGPSNRDGITDEYGDVYFGIVPDGRYSVRAKRQGYRDNQGNADVPVSVDVDIADPGTRPIALRGPAGGGSGSGGRRGGVVRIQLHRIRIEVARLIWAKFLDDHRVLRTRNRVPPTGPQWDYAFGGRLYQEILDSSGRTWQAGRTAQEVDGDHVGPCFPVSYSLGQVASVEAEFDAGPLDAPPENATIMATFEGPLPAGISPEALAFTSPPTQVSSSSHNHVTLVAKQPLPRGPVVLRGDFRWKAVFPDREVQIGLSGTHTIYVTYGLPSQDRKSAELGVTRKRMRRAVRLAHDALVAKWGRFEDVKVRHLMEALHSRYPRYDFALASDMNDEYRAHTNPVGYLEFLPLGTSTWHQPEEWGGTWPHADHPGDPAECQALVRLAYGLMRQLGVVADLQKAVVFAHPLIAHGHLPLYEPFLDVPAPGPLAALRRDFSVATPILVELKLPDGSGRETTERRHVGCRLGFVNLVSPKVGRLYSSVEINQYEAVLRIDADGELFYYLGGLGLKAPPDQNANTPTKDSELQRIALHSFRHLVWYGSYRHLGRWRTVIARVEASYHRANPGARS